MKWISIDDKLPKNKQHVVFWVKYTNSIWHAKTGWLKMQSDGPLLIIPSPSDLTKGRVVTHWMPLPPPPSLQEDSKQ